MEMKRVAVIGLCLVLVVTFSGCVDTSFVPSSNKADGLYTYSLQVTLNKTGEFTLYVPIPVLDNDTPFVAMNNLSITKGNGSFEIADTAYGKALMVKGYMNITIIATLRGSTWVHLGMTSTGGYAVSTHDEAHWVYCNCTQPDQSVLIKINSDSNNWVSNKNGERIRPGGSFNMTIEESLVQGWQIVRSTSSGSVVN